MEHGQRSWSYAKQQHIAYIGHQLYKPDGLREDQTPIQLGCKVGDILKSYPTEKELKQPFRIQDLFVQEAEEKVECNACQNTDSLSAAAVTLKAAGGLWSMPPPISKRPWKRTVAPRRRESVGSSVSYPPVQAYTIDGEHASYQHASQNVTPFGSHNYAYQASTLLTLSSPYAPSPQTPSSAPPPLQQARVMQAPVLSAPAQPAPLQRAQLPPPPPPEVPGESTSAMKGRFPIDYAKIPAPPAEPPNGMYYSSSYIKIRRIKTNGTQKQIYEMPGDMPEKTYNSVDPKLPHDKDKTDLMELTEAQAKNVKTLGLAAGGKLSTSSRPSTFARKSANPQ